MTFDAIFVALLVALDIAIFVALLASVASLASLASPPVAVDNAFDLVVAFLGVYRFGARGYIIIGCGI